MASSAFIWARREKIAFLEGALVFGVFAEVAAFGGGADGLGVVPHLDVDVLLDLFSSFGQSGLGHVEDVLPRPRLEGDGRLTRGEPFAQMSEQILVYGAAEVVELGDLGAECGGHSGVDALQTAQEALIAPRGEYGAGAGGDRFGLLLRDGVTAAALVQRSKNANQDGKRIQLAR